MADDNSAGVGSMCAMQPVPQRSRHGLPQPVINYSKVMNTDTCAVVWLSHQSGISHWSLTVRSVRGTSSHRNYWMDLQHLRSLVGKSLSN